MARGDTVGRYSISRDRSPRFQLPRHEPELNGDVGSAVHEFEHLCAAIRGNTMVSCILPAKSLHAMAKRKCGRVISVDLKCSVSHQVRRLAHRPRCAKLSRAFG